MEGKKETKAVFYIGCPKCNTQVKVDGVFITEIPEKPDPTITGGKDNAGKQERDEMADCVAENAGVPPDS